MNTKGPMMYTCGSIYRGLKFLKNLINMKGPMMYNYRRIYRGLKLLSKLNKYIRSYDVYLRECIERPGLGSTIGFTVWVVSASHSIGTTVVTV